MQIGDTIRATFYGEKNGVLYKSNVDEYAVADYTYSQMKKAAAPTSLKTLCAGLLRYGATAQIYKEYRTDALCTVAMTEEQKTYLSDESKVVFDNYNTTGSDIVDPTVSWVGKSLLLDSKVTIRYIVDLTKYTGAHEDLKLLVNYTDIDGVKQSLYVTELVPYDVSKNRYCFEFDGLLAAELRQKVSVAVFSGDTRLTSVLQYSASTYGNNKTGTLLTLCKHLMAYSDSAKAYFAG